MLSKMFFNKRFFLFLVVAYFIVGCHKDNNGRIPEVYVDFYVNINDPQFFNLQSVGNYVYVKGGVAGIVIYRQSVAAFVAFDRCCSYKPDDRCQVEIDTTTNQKLVCPHCHSEFSLNDGSVLKSPATLPLKQYKADFDGEKVHVYNPY